MYVYMNECMYSCEQHKVCPQWIKLSNHQGRVQNATIQAHISVNIVHLCADVLFAVLYTSFL